MVARGLAMDNQAATAAVVQVSQKLNMRITKMDGEVLEIVIPSTDSIRQTKDKIALCHDIPQECQKLIYGHALLDDCVLVNKYCQDSECKLDVSMVIISPVQNVCMELMDHGFTKPSSDTLSEVKRKLAIVAASAGAVALPACVNEWFTLLAEHGCAQTLFDIDELVENSKFNSHGQLCFHFKEWNCPEWVVQRSVGLMDLKTGALSFFNLVCGDDCWNGPASAWQKRARPGNPCTTNAKKDAYSNLSELLRERLEVAKLRKEAEQERMVLEQHMPGR